MPLVFLPTHILLLQEGRVGFSVSSPSGMRWKHWWSWKFREEGQFCVCVCVCVCVCCCCCCCYSREMERVGRAEGKGERESQFLAVSWLFIAQLQSDYTKVINSVVKSHTTPTPSYIWEIQVFFLRKFWLHMNINTDPVLCLALATWWSLYLFETGDKQTPIFQG